jgi:hypothetical protein
VLCTSLVLAATFSGASDEFGATRACIGVGWAATFAGVMVHPNPKLCRRRGRLGRLTTMGECVNVA